jgi:hypothetical protein
MTDETTQNDGTSQTAGSKDADQTKEEKYSKDQLTEQIKAEVGKVVKKHSKEMDALRLELETERKKSLPDPEKVKLEMGNLAKERDEFKSKFEGLNLKIVKREALEAAKLALPKDVTLTDLLELMPGSEEDIPAHLARFKKIFPAREGLGTSTTIGDKGNGPDIDAQIAEAEKNGDWQQSIKLRNSKFKM